MAKARLLGPAVLTAWAGCSSVVGAVLCTGGSLVVSPASNL